MPCKTVEKAIFVAAYKFQGLVELASTKYLVSQLKVVLETSSYADKFTAADTRQLMQ
jgi:hypothetical protein